MEYSFLLGACAVSHALCGFELGLGWKEAKHGRGKSERRGRMGEEGERRGGIEESVVEWGVGEERMWGKKGYGGVAGEEESENGGGGGREEEWGLEGR